MLILAHIGGVPLEELFNPMAGAMTASVATFVLGAIARRWTRR